MRTIVSNKRTLLRGHVRPADSMLSCVGSVLIGLLLIRSAQGELINVAYSVKGKEKGGVATVTIDTENRKIVDQSTLFESKECREPVKVRRSDDHHMLAVTNIDEDAPSVFLIPLEANQQPTKIALPSIPDELRLRGNLGIVSCEDDEVAFLNLEDKQILRVDKLDKLLQPPTNKPEDVHITSDDKFAVVSFQKDSSTGKKRGSRLVVYSLPEVRLVADLQLPRERPGLHIATNPKESGPGPEIIYVSIQHDVMVVTLDLYGALGLVDWSEAKTGELHSWKMVCASNDDVWGTAFPDRATVFDRQGCEFFLVCNAGEGGGCFLVDLKNRRPIWRRKTPPGLEAPVYLDELQRAFSVCSGKIKRRLSDDVEKLYRPQRSLFEFDFSSNDAMLNAPVKTYDLPGFTFQITCVNPSSLLLISLGDSPEAANRLVLVDANTGSIVDECHEAGTVIRFAQ